ncbi:armadillo repeat-containing protein [Tieghemostelium lacteum]|uniref:Armadillo repeat-containing protein n=1 Tax=Tieghemostelium lacteum TaxID=361077 RepID=A0A151ZDI5_TIELA|nr:armadillo repeat-containing protein [Tieghemostelium lacteum]|eukprot:KYQ92022.1 armadillo repeat-containing protein [Tieghemostelium lacteum]
MAEELDDLLNEMLMESELSTQQQQQQQQKPIKNVTIQPEQIQSNNSSNNNNFVSPQQQSNNNGNSNYIDKRKSRLSQHQDAIGGGFDILDSLLNDVSNESIRNSIKQDNSRIKSLRLTSTYDLETTLKDLEETFSNPPQTQLHKRKPSAFLSKLSTTQTPPQPPNTKPSATVKQPEQQPQQAEEFKLPPPPPPIAKLSNQVQNISNKDLSQLGGSAGSSQMKKFQVSETTEMAHILTKDAIDAADLLDQMIESFGGLPPTPPSITPVNQTSTNVTSGKENPISPRPINGSSTVRGMKLGQAVDLQVTPSPKAPTPIPTLSSPPIHPISAQVNSDQLLDDMIQQFKESTSSIPKSNLSTAVRPVFNQQSYTISPEEQQQQHSGLIQNKNAHNVDEDLVSKILGDNDIEDSNGQQVKGQSFENINLSDKSWYIKVPNLSDQEKNNTLGSGNNGQTKRAGVYKEKRIVCKSWDFITPQATPQLFHEIEQLIAIKHPNIIPLVGASFDQHFLTFSEYITANNLDLVLRNLDEQTELQTIVRLGEEIAAAMAFLHSFNIVHRSLHPKNILLNSDLKVSIKDYGFTSLKDETLRKKLLSPLSNQIKHHQYLAPELYNVVLGGKGGYDQKVDVFSFGVLLWEMFARDLKLSDLKSNTINGYTHYLRPSLSNCPFTLEKLIRLCISTDPSVRPSFQTILKILRQPLHTLQRYQKPTNSTSNGDSQQQTVDSKAQLQEYNEKRDKIIRLHGICKNLVDQPLLSNLSKAASTIESICKNTDYHQFILELDFIPLIFTIMENLYEDIQILCLKIFNLLITEDPSSEPIQDNFRNLLGINVLMQSLTSKNETIIFQALRILATLSHKEESRLEILSKNGVHLLIPMVSNQNESIKMQVIWNLSLLLESQQCQDEFVRLGGVQLLVDMFVFSKNNGFDLRLASALSKVLPIKACQEIINTGPYRERVMKKYIQLLGDIDFETLRMLGLEAIACLVGDKENQNLLINDDVITLFSEYLQLDARNDVAPQMTAIKILLTLAIDHQNIPYLTSKSYIIPSLEILLQSPHPSIQKASEKLLNLLK